MTYCDDEGQPVSSGKPWLKSSLPKSVHSPTTMTYPLLAPLQAPRTDADCLWRHRSRPNPSRPSRASFPISRCDRRSSAHYSGEHGRLYGQPLRRDVERCRFVCSRSANSASELNYSSDIDLVFLYEQDGQTDARRIVSNVDFSSGSAKTSSVCSPKLPSSVRLSRRTCVFARKVRAGRSASASIPRFRITT